jgi:hypothetical protein
MPNNDKKYTCSTSAICMGLSSNVEKAASSMARTVFETCKAGLSSIYSALGLPEKVGLGGAKFKTPMSAGDSSGGGPSTGASPDASSK